MKAVYLLTPHTIEQIWELQSLGYDVIEPDRNLLSSDGQLYAGLSGDYRYRRDLADMDRATAAIGEFSMMVDPLFVYRAARFDYLGKQLFIYGNYTDHLPYPFNYRVWRLRTFENVLEKITP